MNAIYELNKRFRITESALTKAELWFLPSQAPVWVGTDFSMISAYGQDNWASVFALLYGFLSAKQPEYTKIAVFYDKEEIGDTGRGSLGTKFIDDIVLPSLANLVGKELGDQWKMTRNSWSAFIDVTEPIQPYTPQKHDPRDSAYLGSGVTILPTSGDVGNLWGYESSPEFRHAISKLFKEKRIPHQFAIMGRHDNTAGGNSAEFHLSMAEGIDLSVPLLGMHRTNELTSMVDLWYLFKAVNAFYMVTSHDAYLPKIRA